VRRLEKKVDDMKAERVEARGGFYLRMGTPIHVAPSADMDHKTHGPRSRWEGSLAQDVTVKNRNGSAVVWRAGTRVYGTVAKSGPAGFALKLSGIGGRPLADGGLHEAADGTGVPAQADMVFEMRYGEDVTAEAKRGR
jgi:hypothetical protein